MASDLQISDQFLIVQDKAHCPKFSAANISWPVTQMAFTHNSLEQDPATSFDFYKSKYTYVW